MICGLILAGGRSSRFGREKAIARLGGATLIEAVFAVLKQGCREIAVSAKAGSEAAAFAAMQGLHCLPDPEGAPAGPLSGVLEGLRWAARLGADGLVTAPCDTPFLPIGLVQRLADGSRLTMAATAEGPQPLTAYWPISTIDALEQVLTHGEHPAAQKFLKQLGAEEAIFEDVWRFANINTPQEYMAAMELMSAISLLPTSSLEGRRSGSE